MKPEPVDIFHEPEWTLENVFTKKVLEKMLTCYSTVFVKKTESMKKVCWKH